MMKLFARPKCFSEALTLMTILSCLLGLRTFEYPRGYPRPVLSLIYFLFIYGIFYSGSFRMQEKYYANNVKLLKTEYVLYQLLSYIIITSVIFKMFLGWWHTKKFKVCYKKIFEVDKTLRQLGLSVNYDRIYFVTIGMITIWITTAFIICTVLLVQLQIRTDIFTSIYIILVYMYAFTVNGISILEFCIFVKYLQIKFKLVNQLLCESLTNLSTKKIKLGVFELKDYAKIINTEKQKHIHSMKMIFRKRRRVQPRINVSVPEKRDQIISQIESHFPSQLKNELQSELQNRFQKYYFVKTKCQERKHLLQTLKQVHLELCKISKIVCTIFGVQTAWEIGEMIMILIGSLYSLYIRFIIQQYKIKSWADQSTFVLAICFLYSLKVVPLSRICKYGTIEGNKTIEIIHTINGCDANMQEEIQQFGIQILQSPVTFSVFGLTLDYRILTMILGTVTTKLVIMIQVGNMLELNNAAQSAHF